MMMISDELLVKYIVGETEPYETAMVEQWRKASAENENHLHQFETLWEKSAGLKEAKNVNMDLAWQKVQQKINRNIYNKRKISRMNTKWLLAASFAILLGIGTLIFRGNRQNTEEILVSKVTSSQQNLQLADGSKIIIKSGILHYPKTFKGAKRSVILDEGRAFFDIASNQNQPFEIKADHTFITVIGTEFEITTNNKYTQVLVKEGKVKFNTPSGELFLSAGMGGRYTENTHLLEKINSESKNTFGYISSKLKFENQLLSQVVKDLNNYYDESTVQLHSKELENCRITSSFDHDDLETVLNVIALTLNLEIEHLPDSKVILLKGKGCKE